MTPCNSMVAIANRLTKGEIVPLSPLPRYRRVYSVLTRLLKVGGELLVHVVGYRPLTKVTSNGRPFMHLEHGAERQHDDLP